MSAALRAGIALCAVSLVACDSILGLKDLVSDGAPVRLSFNNSVAARGVAQQPMDVITVSVQDIQGKPAQGFSGEIKLKLGNNPGGAKLIGAATATVTASVTATAGTVYFDAVGIDRAATGYTLVASADGLEPATSDHFDVVAPPFMPVVTGFSGGPITSVAVLPAPSGGTPTLLAGAGNGLYSSVDGGASWKLASFGGDTAARLVVDPKHPGVVYSGHLFGSEFLKKSVDSGATWHRLGLGDSELSFSFVYSFDIDPKDPSVIYAADSARLRRSTDGGVNWSPVALAATCRQLAIDPATTSSIYCTAYDPRTQQSLGVYKSSDSGATWGAVNSGLISLDTGLLLATPNAIFVAAGNTLYRSTDAGTSWTSLPMTSPGSMAYAPSMPKRIYLSQGGGVSVSNDAGASFGQPVVVTPAAIPFPDFIQGLTVDPANADVVYAAGSAHGVFVSTNGGVNWSTSTGIDAPRIDSMAMASSVPGTLLTSIAGTVLRTTNSGTSWTTVAQVAASIHFDPTISTRVYLCGFNFFSTSTNSGASFSGGNNPDFFGCNRLAVAGATLFATGNARVYKSTNSGTTWADTGLGGTPPGFFVNDVALGDATGSVVVASTSQGFYRSTNGGTTFTQVTTDFNNAIVADPRAPTHVIAGQCPGFRISTDGGASFGSTIPGPCVESLIATGSAFYAAGAGTAGTPVLVTSTDGGASWAPIEIADGLPSGLSITSIAASDDGKTIYLGTPAGLYKSAGP